MRCHRRELFPAEEPGSRLVTKAEFEQACADFGLEVIPMTQEEFDERQRRLDEEHREWHRAYDMLTREEKIDEYHGDAIDEWLREGWSPRTVAFFVRRARMDSVNARCFMQRVSSGERPVPRAHRTRAEVMADWRRCVERRA